MAIALFAIDLQGRDASFRVGWMPAESCLHAHVPNRIKLEIASTASSANRMSWACVHPAVSAPSQVVEANEVAHVMAPVVVIARAMRNSSVQDRFRNNPTMAQAESCDKDGQFAILTAARVASSKGKGMDGSAANAEGQ
jgi:hypothetical protein